MAKTIEEVKFAKNEVQAVSTEERASAKTWDGLSRMAFAANWDPEGAINWNQTIELGHVREGWINILHYFYEGEWQGLEIIERLMNKAAHMYKLPEMVTYYATQ